MSDPLVTCRRCGYTWHSAGMADGLRLLGSCPRCRGELEFADGGERAAPADAPIPEPDVTDKAPHMVLGVPRR